MERLKAKTDISHSGRLYKSGEYLPHDEKMRELWLKYDSAFIEVDGKPVAKIMDLQQAEAEQQAEAKQETQTKRTRKPATKKGK